MQDDGFEVVDTDTSPDAAVVAEFLGDPGPVFERSSESNEPPLQGSREARFRKRSSW